jgi:hypothetical protein
MRKQFRSHGWRLIEMRDQAMSQAPEQARYSGRFEQPELAGLSDAVSLRDQLG